MKVSLRTLVAIGALLVGALVIAWFALSAGPAQPVTLAAANVAPRRSPQAPVAVAVAGREIPPTPDPEEVLDVLGIDPKETPFCAQIWQWSARRVPGWVITDNIEAGAMFFDEKEMGCLTATPNPPPDWMPPLPGGILEMADARPKYPQPNR